MGTRKNNNLLKSEEGQILIYVLIVVLVAALIVPPLIGLTYSGYRSAIISNDKMTQFYAADTGIEDAIYQLIYRGNDTPPEEHNLKVPIDFGLAGSTTYWIGDNLATEDVEKAEINGCNVWLYLERVDDTKYGNNTYIIKATSTYINDEPEITNKTETKAIIEAKIVVGVIYNPYTGEEPGPGGRSPFSYAVATLGHSSPLTLTASSGQPNTLSGDIYSAGNMIIDSNIQILPNLGKPSTVWANGTLVIGTTSYVSGDAHSQGDMTLDPGAMIGFNAYSGGSITLGKKTGGSAAGIGNSGYATVDITLYNSSTIGNGAEAGGDINVNSVDLPATAILGNAYAHGNIVGDGKKDNSAIIYGNAIAGGSISPQTSKWIIKGNEYPNTVPPPPAPSLPVMPVIVNPQVSCWQNFYYEEAHGYDPEVDDPLCPSVQFPNAHSRDGYESGPISLQPNETISLGLIHIEGDNDPKTDDLYLASGNTLYLTDTVYINGSVMVKNGSKIRGAGKLVATGDITIQNSADAVGNSTDLPFIMSINGDINLSNVGNVSAAFYAPNGNVDIGTNDYIFGSVVAQSITNGNNIVLTYDQRVQNIPGLPGGWEEGNGNQETHGQNPWPGPGAYIIWYNVVK